MKHAPSLHIGQVHVLVHYKTAGTLTSLFTPCMECCGNASCLHIPINREESNVRKDKRITMAQ